MKKALSKHRLNQLQHDLALYQKYLPALDLKRQQLMARQKKMQRQIDESLEHQAALFEQLDFQFPWLATLDLPLQDVIQVDDPAIKEEKVMGVLMLVQDPTQNITYSEFRPSVEIYKNTTTGGRLAQPHWLVNLYLALKPILETQLNIERLTINLTRLSDATKKATQKVNLFSKVMIPEANEEIRRINLFLGDQEKAAVIRSKLVKRKQQILNQELGAI